MKIGLISDIHIEMYRVDLSWRKLLPRGVDVLVLAGDICNGTRIKQVIDQILEVLPGIEIVFVCGNHEFWYSNIDVIRTFHRQILTDYPNVHYLENESVEIDGITFLGCTFWTGFNCYGDPPMRTCMVEAHYDAADFQYIKIDSNNRNLVPSDMLFMNEASCNYLSAEIPKSDPTKTVVVTHFPPLRELQHGTIEESLITPYFQAHAPYLIEDHKPALWLYGHNHWSEDRVIGSTRCISNQPGYKNEKGTLERYKKDLVIEI
ncbi:MAG: metallophosphoesterase [Pseudomonadales bacterium]